MTSVPAFAGKVYVIVGENTSLSQFTMKNAPYQLDTIKPAGAWLTDYWGISHYSTSNYIAMTSGQFLECHQLDEKPATCNQDVPNIFGQLQQAGISWAEWNESMPQPCYLVNAGENRFGNAYRVKAQPRGLLQGHRPHGLPGPGRRRQQARSLHARHPDGLHVAQ